MLDVVIPVYNGAETIGRTLSVLLAQRGSGASWSEIIVVDDGSSDDVEAVVASLKDHRIRIIRSDSRNGRGNACNMGVAASTAEFVMFLDADCWPLFPDLIDRHMRMISAGADVSFGRIEGAGNGFWKQLATEIAREREVRVKQGDYLGMASWNMALSRDLFVRVGGFCEEYRHYGFEDRDLLAVLDEHGSRFRFDSEAVVARYVDTSVSTLCRKMEVAGQHTARVFRDRHPEQYARMRYSRVDASTASPLIRPILRMLTAFQAPLEQLSSMLVDVRWLPFFLRMSLLRSAMALAYMRGTIMERSG